MHFESTRITRRAFCVAVMASIAFTAAALQWPLASAQNTGAKPAPPGDHLDTPGPLATNLSPKLKRAELAKAMKLVADWQLNRLPAEAQYDWTFAALYAGYMGVPNDVAGDKYKQAMMDVGEKLHWAPGPR
ncbi:MAG TPA: hypothetical protein VL498_07270, partial [Terracidiphilus sp.]|nr:hypothetical protein [Terracidiphilus sp.]